jgi:hypothetical protein
MSERICNKNCENFLPISESLIEIIKAMDPEDPVSLGDGTCVLDCISRVLKTGNKCFVIPDAKIEPED